MLLCCYVNLRLLKNCQKDDSVDPGDGLEDFLSEAISAHTQDQPAAVSGVEVVDLDE